MEPAIITRPDIGITITVTATATDNDIRPPPIPPSPSPLPTGLLIPEEEQEEEESTSYPEGGLQAWLVVFGAWCCMASSTGLINAFGVFQAYLSVSHQQQHDDGGKRLAGFSEASIGWIFSVHAFIVYFAGAQVGSFLSFFFEIYAFPSSHPSIQHMVIFASFAYAVYISPSPGGERENEKKIRSSL